MSTWITNGATVLQFRPEDFQIPLVPPKRRTQRLINNTAGLPVVQTVSEAQTRILTCEVSLYRADQGVYAGADSLYSFYESADPSGVKEMANTFMLTDADGVAYQCRFIDDMAGGLREVKKDADFQGSFRLLVEHTLPSDESTGPILWLAAYDMDHNGGDLTAWTTLDKVGNTAAEWEDKSGNDTDGLQGTDGDRPLWTTSQINSRPAVDFISSDFLEVNGIATSFDNVADTAWTAYFVADVDGTGAKRHVLGLGDNSAIDDQINFLGVGYGAGTDKYGVEIHDGSTPVSADGDAHDSSPHILSIICPGTTVSGWVDGVKAALDADAFNVGVVNVDRGRVGCQIVQDVESEFWDGRIGEVILFLGAHTTIQRRRQEYRLADMWGISLTA